MILIIGIVKENVSPIPIDKLLKTFSSISYWSNL